MVHYANPVIMILPMLTVVLVFIINAHNRQVRPPTNPVLELLGFISFVATMILVTAILRKLAQ